jgi:hypothetical protein
MGAIWSQQGCLKLNKNQGLTERNELKTGRKYTFSKPGHRLYMLDTPMQLVTGGWKAIATIMITEITVGNGKTRGTFEVLKVYSDEEMEIVSGTLVPFDRARQAK